MNIDGGAAVDPETGFLYVGAQSGLNTIEVAKDPMFGASRQPESARQLWSSGRTATAARLQAEARGAEARALGRVPTTTIGGVSIVKPKELGGITVYNLNTGDKAWWIPNGGQFQKVTSDDPLFRGVTLPPDVQRAGSAAGDQHEIADDLWNGPERRATGRRAHAVRGGQGYGQAGGRGGIRVEDERGADDFDALWQAIHCVRDRGWGWYGAGCLGVAEEVVAWGTVLKALCLVPTERPCSCPTGIEEQLGVSQECPLQSRRGKDNKCRSGPLL